MISKLKQKIFNTGQRKTLTRILAVCLVILMIFTRDPILLDEAIYIIMEFTGLLLVSIAAFGRLWCTLYIGGYKNKELIQSGPYSIFRHPLYFFSAIGVFGLGLASCNSVVLLLLLLGFVIYYPGVMLTEEEKLYKKHGEDFKQYCSRVPRIFPSFKNFQQPQHLQVSVPMFNKAVLDNIWFILGFILLRTIVWLHFIEFIPSYSLTLL